MVYIHTLEFYKLILLNKRQIFYWRLRIVFTTNQPVKIPHPLKTVKTTNKNIPSPYIPFIAIVHI